jgi:hypothetical protein
MGRMPARYIVGRKLDAYPCFQERRAEDVKHKAHLSVRVQLPQVPGSTLAITLEVFGESFSFREAKLLGPWLVLYTTLTHFTTPVCHARDSVQPILWSTLLFSAGSSLDVLCMWRTCIIDHGLLGGSQHQIEGGYSGDEDELATRVLNFPVSYEVPRHRPCTFPDNLCRTESIQP